MADRVCIDCGGPISRTSKGRCQKCNTIRLQTDPEILARGKAARAEFLARPETKAKLKARMAIYFANMPEADRERRREHGRKIYERVLNSPETRAKSNSPDARRRAGAARTATVLAWCPPAYLERYRELTRTGAATAPDARRAIEEQIAHDERRRIAAMDPFERQLEAAARVGIVEKQDFRKISPSFTLGGVAPEAM